VASKIGKRKMKKAYYEDKYATIYHGDCLEFLPEMKKFDLVLTDPPYGVTGLNWDIVVSFDKLWELIGKVQSVFFFSTAVHIKINLFKY